MKLGEEKLNLQKILGRNCRDKKLLIWGNNRGQLLRK